MRSMVSTAVNNRLIHCDQLISIFDRIFFESHRTCLIKGGIEPEYIPSGNDNNCHQVIFTQDYFSSALHEIAHWCVAGFNRRKLYDYGYWYTPDGRNEQQQKNFERVEVKPQALEWLFSQACGISFRLSVDNLEACLGASDEFKLAIVNQAHQYCTLGVNDRAGNFINALCQYYQTTDVFNFQNYCIECL